MGKTIKSGYSSDGIKMKTMKKKKPRSNRHINVDDFMTEEENDYYQLDLDDIENRNEDYYTDND